jgi:hypothetical protein
MWPSDDVVISAGLAAQPTKGLLKKQDCVDKMWMNGIKARWINSAR